MIKKKLITARKEKNMSQKSMSDLLYMNQSQYQRRERGEVRISDEEWMRMAKLLGKEIEDIKEEDCVTTIHNYDNHSQDYSTSNNYFYSIPESMIKISRNISKC